MALQLVSERIGQFFHDGHRLEYTEYGGGDSVGRADPRPADAPPDAAAAGARTWPAEGLHVVTLDLLGHGRSDRPDDPLDYSMTAFGEQVIALLDHLGADQAVIGGTSLGANVSLEVAVLAPERVRGLIAEMPVLDNALEAGILAFAPLLFAARFLPLSISGLRAVTRADPAGRGPVLDRHRAGHLRPARRHRWRRPSTASSSAGSPPRRAPASRSRPPRWWSGHQRDPIHPAADAAMLAEELPDATFVQARSILEWRFRPSGSTGWPPTSPWLLGTPAAAAADRRRRPRAATGRMRGCLSTATRPSCCAPTSWERPTASSPC